MKKTKFILSILLLLIFISGCASNTTISKEAVPGVTDKEILIGSSSALTGQTSFLGTQTIHGSLAYINQVNEKGGVYGRKIKLISYDDQYTPNMTVENTKKLINDDKVFALFDYVGTPTSVKIIDTVQESKIPALGFFTGAEALRTPFRPYIFNVRDSYYSETEEAIKYFVDKKGFKKIAIMYQDDAFGQAVLDGTKLALGRRQMEIIASDKFVRGTMDLENQLKTIKASNPDVVIMVGTYSPLAKFIRISHDEGFKPYFYTVSFVGSEAYGKELVNVQKIDASEYDKIIVTQVVPSPFSNDYKTVKEFRDAMKKYYPDDEFNYVALEGYMNAKVLTDALKASGEDLTREKFISSLETMNDVDMGIGKSITYSPSDHQGIQGVYYSKLTPDATFRIFK